LSPSLRRVGAAFYLARLFSLLTGAAFVLLITRNLPVEDYGAWSTISSLLAYAAAASFINYWTTRLRASGAAEVTPTALLLSASISLPATLAYALASGYAARTFGLPRDALLISAAYVPLLYANSALYASALGCRPIHAALSEVSFELAKLAAALVAVALGRVDLRAALLSVLAGHAAQLLSLAWSLRSDLGARPSPKLARRILSLAPASALSLLPPLVGGLDVLLISALASNEAVAYYTIVAPFMNAVAYSYFLARGLYPALLAGSADGEQLVEEALRLVALLAVPSAVGIAATAPYLLFVLRPEYSAASGVLAVSAFLAALDALRGVLSDAVQGLERRDLEGAGLGEVLRSRILSVQALSCARAAAGAALVAAIALALREPLQVALSARAAWLALAAAELAVLARWARIGRAATRVSGAALRYLLAALAAAALARALHPLRLREVLAAGLLSASVYFALAYALDPWFRALAEKLVKRLLPLPHVQQDGRG